MSKGEVVVEGDLNLEDDASSSESERESEGGYNEPPLEFSDNEEETLEVFAKVPSKPKVVEKPKPKETPKLNEVVSQMTFESEEADAIDINFEDNDTPDEFGITYKKPTKSTPKAPVDSEFILETPIDINAALQAMKANTTAVAVDDDDEFGFDAPEADTSASDAIRKALESVAKRETVEQSNEIHVDNSDFLINPQASAAAASTGPVLQPIDEPILAGKSSNSVGTKKSSALADARKAYQDVIEVYGGGMGDQEVLLLDEKEEASKAGKANKGGPVMPLTAQIDKSVRGNVIEEGDEEEEEEEEQREATRQQEQVEKVNQLQSEWDSVQTVAPTTASTAAVGSKPRSTAAAVVVEEEDDGFLTSSPSVSSTPAVDTTGTYSPVTYKSTLNLVQNSGDLSRFESSIVYSEKPPQSSSSSSWFGMGRSSSSDISYPGYQLSDLKLPFLIAQLDYDPSVYINTLRTIYYFLIPSATPKTKGDSSAIINSTGGHWEKIGFQGVDPRTDLNRSMKMLSILQMLEFMESDPHFFRQLHTLSGSADAASSHLRSSKMDTSWPLMCVAIMFTKEAIQALRGGVLNAKCSKYESVMKALNTFHHSCFFEFHRLLTEQPSVHHAVHLAALRKQCSENPLKIMNAYRNHLKKPASTTANATVSTNKTGSNSVGGGGGGGVPGPAQEEMLTSFDNLESLDESNVKDDNGGGGAGWFGGVGGGGKASKFAVK